jgi:hypothetical protein
MASIGNTLTIALFTGNFGDHAAPVDQITYALVP